VPTPDVVPPLGSFGTPPSDRASPLGSLEQPAHAITTATSAAETVHVSNGTQSLPCMPY